MQRRTYFRNNFSLEPLFSGTGRKNMNFIWLVSFCDWSSEAISVGFTQVYHGNPAASGAPQKQPRARLLSRGNARLLEHQLSSLITKKKKKINKWLKYVGHVKRHLTSSSGIPRLWVSEPCSKWHLVNVPLSAGVLLTSPNYRILIGWTDGGPGANPRAPSSTPEPFDMPFCF